MRTAGWIERRGGDDGMDKGRVVIGAPQLLVVVVRPSVCIATVWSIDFTYGIV